MFNKLLPALFVLILSAPLITQGQTSQIWSDYWEAKQTPVVKEQAVSDPGLFKSAALVWIRIYQKGIASQDLPACVFHPSCSRFTFAAIEQYGALRGILLGGDRLLRCNPFAYQHYPFDGQKFSDPIENYPLRKKPTNP